MEHLRGLLLALAVLVVLAGSGCAGDGDRGDGHAVDVLELRVSADGRTLSLNVAACRRGPYTVDVRESSEEVRVEVRAAEAEQAPAPACVEVVPVKLDSPLGKRVVVDATSANQVPVLEGRASST